MNIPGKGRGVLATQDIFPGQLVLVTKPFAIVFGIEDWDEQEITLQKIIAQKLIFADEDTRKSFGNLSYSRVGRSSIPSNFVCSYLAQGGGKRDVYSMANDL